MPKQNWAPAFAGATAIAIAACATLRGADVAPRTDYAAVAQAVGQFIQHEMADKELPAVSIALVDDQQTVWAQGFGYADPEKKTPATAETVYRIGSVSKLFTDIAVMQRVEQGALDLDAPVTRYLPDFRPKNRFGRDITLRQLMTHRSGLVREPPVGHYFDPTTPTLAQTVASLNDTALVYAPESQTKYSNAAIAAVGYVLEQTQHEPFAKYLQRAVLEPLGMARSSFEPAPELMRDVPKAVMRTVEGRTFPAPTFELGMAPAGSMYATVTDLGRFVSALLAGGQGAKGRVLKAETLQQMWTPQYAQPGQRSGFGIGFVVRDDWDGSRFLVGHGGAIYGYATTLAALPKEKLGVAVVATVDVANAVTNRIGRYALQAALAMREGRPSPPAETTQPIEPARARQLEGRYARGDDTIELVERAGQLFLFAEREGLLRLRALGDGLIVDDRLSYGLRLTPKDDAIATAEVTFRRVPAAGKPKPPPKKWRGLIGEYGWDHDVLYIFEKDGALWALIEWIEFDKLASVSKDVVGAPHGRDVYRLPAQGLYEGEQLEFTRDAAGRATQVRAGTVVFRRRAVGPEEGATQLRIAPVRPVPELLAEAQRARPPREPGPPGAERPGTDQFRPADLVELTKLDATIRLDVRYATTNNFLGSVFYSQPRAFLQRPAAEALLRVHRKLRKQGYGLLIHDAYRPWYVTKVFWDATPDDKKDFVADPSQGSRHNRGCAVDLTLYDLKTGRPVEMVATYDEISDRSHADYPGGTSLQRWHRALLRDAMESEGFTIFPLEWWHFDFDGWQHYPIGNARFEEIMQ